ncbi:MAG: glycosyltransferase family 9 protein, partial [Nitrospirota bacterium]|nr:glycosyltransferase family 9 protein [Nitrospirota bacterium]
KDWEWARKILVVRNDNIGDVICTTPALEALRQAYPKAHIAVLVAKYTKEAVEGNPFVDKVYSYQKAKHAGFAGESKLKAWVDQLRLIRDIRKEKFDIAIGIRSKFTPSLGWLVFASGAPLRVGHRPRPKDWILSFFFNLFAADETELRHEVERAMGVVRAIGVDAPKKRLWLDIPSAEHGQAMKFIGEHRLKRGRRLVCLHLTSRMEENRWWSPENYVRIAQYLLGRKDVDLVLNWTPKDQGLADTIMRELGYRPLVYSASSLKGFAAFAKQCDLLITLEGGAMHLSAAVGTPTLAIFGSTSDIIWSPWGDKNITLRGGDHANSVKPEDVIAAVDRMLPTTDKLPSVP